MSEEARIDWSFTAGHVDGVKGHDFHQESRYTTFDVEYSICPLTGLLCFHFFFPEDATQDYLPFWGSAAGFGAALERSVLSYWDPDTSRFAAAWVDGGVVMRGEEPQDQGSWWLRASGFGLSGNPVARCQRFFEVLDAAVDQQRAQAGPH